MGKWAMFPNPDEQESLLNWDVQMLTQALLESDDGKLTLVAAAAYDLFYAAKMEEKAKGILLAAVSIKGIQSVVQAISEQVAFRIHWDGQSEEEQRDFLEFCEKTLNTPIS